MDRTDSGLFVAKPFDFFFRRHKATQRIVTLPNGKRVNVSLDDSRTVQQIEEDDRLHAVVRPRTTIIKIRRQQ